MTRAGGGAWLGVLVIGVGLFVANCSDDEAEPNTPTGGEGGSGLTAGSGGAGGEAGAGGELPPFEIDGQRMHDDVVWLTDPERTGRAPATPGNDAALDYVETLFTDLGLTPVGAQDSFRQAFSFDRWVQQSPSAGAVDGNALTAGTDFFTAAYSGTVDVTADMVFVGYGMSVPSFDLAAYPQCPLDPTGFDEYAAVDVTGKIAVVLRHGPNDTAAIHDSCPGGAACVSEPCLWNFGYKVANARSHGAAAVLITPDYRHAADDIIAPHLGEEYYHADMAALFVDRSVLESSLPSLQTWADAIDNTILPNSQETTVTATVTVSATTETAQTENLLAAAEGTDPTLADEVVVVGAHIDHLGTDVDTGEMYPGADDNASGTAVVMELARAMVGTGAEPARTVLFASWNAEEIGLVGSCTYVSQPVYPMADTLMAFSIDMVGAGDESGIAVFGGREPGNAWLMETMRGAAQDDGLSYSIGAADPSDASDHACFAYGGAAGVMITTLGDHDYYHTPQDTADTVTPGNLEVTARIMWSTVRTLATASEGQYTTSAQVRGAAPAVPPVAADPRARTR